MWKVDWLYTVNTRRKVSHTTFHTSLDLQVIGAVPELKRQQGPLVITANMSAYATPMGLVASVDQRRRLPCAIKLDGL